MINALRAFFVGFFISAALLLMAGGVEYFFTSVDGKGTIYGYFLIPISLLILLPLLNVLSKCMEDTLPHDGSVDALVSGIFGAMVSLPVIVSLWVMLAIVPEVGEALHAETLRLKVLIACAIAPLTFINLSYIWAPSKKAIGFALHRYAEK
jgi:hypothetical protein